MKRNSLNNTNPFLINNNVDTKKRVTTCVASSTAVETGKPVGVIAGKLERQPFSKHSRVTLAKRRSS